MDGWDGWMDGRMDRWMDGQMDGCMHAWTDGWMNGQPDGWMDGWMDGRMDEWTDIHRDAGMDGWVLVLQEVSEAGASHRAGQEIGGEHGGDTAVCPGAQEVTDYIGRPVLMK